GDAVLGTAVFDDFLVFGFDLVDVALAFGLDEDLDARLVLVVAASPAVVDAHDGFEVIQDLLGRQEFADDGGNRRRAAHAAANLHFEAELALLVLDELQADVVPGRGRAVFGGTVDGDLELARQEGEFGM